MKIASVLGLTAALAVSLDAGHKAVVGDGPSAAPDVTVYVDGAGVLFNWQTRTLADRMLATAGVRVAWRLGKPNPNAADGLVIGVRFIGANKYSDYQSGALARAYVFGGGVRNITVLHHRVRATAAAAGVEDYRLTAHVLVHEIGHVLQRIDRHSDSGVMKTQWTHADYEVMARKTLPLAAEDIKLIRRGLEGARDRNPAGGRE
jgi:hypothetical protein